MIKNPGLLFVIVIYLVCAQCKKSAPSDADNCAEIQKVRITGAKTVYHVGDSISLGVNLLPAIALFTWTSSAMPNTLSGDQSLFIYPCSKSDQGWYYLDVSYPACAQDYDSVYITVINDTASAPCAPATNSVTFSSIPNISFTTSWGLDPDFNCRNLSASVAPGYPDFNVYFDFYWNTVEPEDGPYTISSTITFDDNNPYSVFIASTYSSIYFQADPGTVYVSHVNGKLQVTFCNLNLEGDLGSTAYNTTATGNLSAP
jgi:hypothetical protein